MFPLCESPIEEMFMHNAIKYLREDVIVYQQVEAPTPWGKFRMDFVLMGGGPKIAVECDGKDFHDPYRDEWRDALLLGTGAVDTIYHFRGCDLVYHVESLIYWMSRRDSHLFSSRGIYNLELMKERGFRDLYVMFGRRTHLERDGEREHWRQLYEFAERCGAGRTLDSLIEMRKSKIARSVPC